MSSTTWTPGALASERRAFRGTGWRFVEAQHHVSTLKLVDSAAEQDVLEDLLEASKPPYPPECERLDFLLKTPFRYMPYPQGSRFRAAGLTPGVFYASRTPEGAAAEMAFYRLLFHAESPATPWPANAQEFTAFSVEIDSKRAIDLTRQPLVRDRDTWTHPTAYAPCQALAEAAREAGMEVIGYELARDPAKGANLAVLSCGAFAQAAPGERQTWRIRLSRNGAQALREFPRLRIEYDRAAFAADQRIAALRWDR